jgi:hypothetical protein
MRLITGGRALIIGILIACGVASARQTPVLASIRGAVQDAKGSPATGVFVVVFTSDASRWTAPESERLVRRVPVEAGQYAVADLPAGNYQFTVTSEAALVGWPAAGTIARLAGTRPMPVRLAAGEVVEINARITIEGTAVTIAEATLSRSFTELRPRAGGPPPPRPPGFPAPVPRPVTTYPGAISGRVTDADGNPVAGADILSLKRSSAGSLLPFHQTGTTGADGRYRLENRSAGDYLVVALPYARGTPPGAGTDWRTPAPVSGADGIMRGYVATFHGGSAGPETATRVSGAAAELSGIDIQLMRRPLFAIEGSIVSGPGQTDPGGSGGLPMPSPIVTVAPLSTDPLGGAAVRRARVNADRTFLVPDLPAGEYRVSASSPSFWVDERLVVGSSAPAPVRLVARPVMPVSGRVEFVGSTAPPADVTNPAQFGVEMRPSVLTFGSSFARNRITADGSFATSAVGSGPFRLNGIAPSPWIQIQGLVNGVDTLDVPAPTGVDITDAVVVFADRPTTLVIRVHDEFDRPVSGASVVLFSEDTRYWATMSRRVQLSQTSPVGTWTPTNVPPGRYFAFATRALSATTILGPELLGRFKQGATVFDLAAGQSRSVRLRVN